MQVTLVADAVDRDPGLLGTYLQDAGATIRYLDRSNLPADSGDADLLILLGSNRSAHDPQQAAVVASEVSLIQRSLAQEIPVMGICFGAQVLARALGGSSNRGATPECGWTPVMSRDDTLCPPGRWGQMHHDVIIPPASSTVIGWSAAGPQAFTDSSAGARAIGWQFHPEMTLPTFERWLRWHYSGSERSDNEEVLAEAQQHAPATALRALDLFGAAFEYLRVEQHHSSRRFG